MNLVGEKFGSWEVLEKGPSDKYWNRRWLCRCRCGKQQHVLQNSLVYGHSLSCCSCANKKTAKERGKANTTHGRSSEQVYKVWTQMIQRCTNPNDTAYPEYGGRGITVHEDWIGRGGFERFIEHIGKRPSDQHTVDRIDNNGNYEPGNVRWATSSEQARNTRRSRVIEFDGERLTLAEWAERTGMKRETIARRLNLAWSSERALTEPVHRSIYWHGELEHD